MKNVKKVLMILGSLIILGQISFSEVNLKDPNIQRLIKIAKEKEAAEKRAEQEAKRAAELAAKQEKLAKEKEEREKKEIEKKVGQEAQNKKIIQEKEAENEKVMEEKEEKARKIAAEKEEKDKKLAEEKAKKLAYKNMTESERMDVEIQRIKGEIEAITHNIDKYKKNTEFLNQMEQRFELLENKMKK